MKIDLVNPYVTKIIIAARKEDSIRAISQRIQVSYGWTYKWMQALVKEGIFRVTKTKVYSNEKNEIYQKIMAFMREVLAKDISFYYNILSLFGVEYCFTKTDAVFIWTKGGYNIARYKQFYPIFIKVKTADREIFETYCKKLRLSLKKKKGIFYEVIYANEIKKTIVDGMPVDPLEETIIFMEKNKYNFQPALEMIKEMHHKKIEAKYREVITNV